jgi:iron complex outermembrane receptor protein
MLGSFGARSLWAHAGAGDARGAFLVGARIEEATNDYTFVNDGGTPFDPTKNREVALTNADAHTLDAWALGTLALGRDARADLVVNEVERRQGLPLALFPSKRARVAVSRQLVGVTTHLPCNAGGGKPSCDVSTTTSLLVSSSGYDDPLREVALGTTHLDVAASRLEQAVLARWPLAEGLVLAPSANVSVEHLGLVPTGGPPLHADQIAGRVAIGAAWDPLAFLGVHATASLSCSGTAVRGPSPWTLAADSTAAGPTLHACSEGEPSARLGVKLGGKPVALLVNAGRYARVPTLAERYGISGAVRGNGALTAEHALSADVGVRASAPASWGIAEAAIDAFAFARYATDLIAYERTSLGYVQPFNVGAARILGGEILATVRPVRVLRLDVAVTLLDPRDISANRTTVNDLLPYQARLIVTPRAELRVPFASRTVSAAKLAVSYLYEAARYADPAGLVVIPAQGSLDVDAELVLLGEHLFLRGRLSNLLDQTRVDLVGYPLPGRAGYLNLEARW